jgi:hypothetical protein
LNPLYPVVKDEFQFRSLNLTQKLLNAREKILWPWELLFCHFYVPEKPEVGRCQVRTVRQMGQLNNRIFSGKVLRCL